MRILVTSTVTEVNNASKLEKRRIFHCKRLFLLFALQGVATYLIRGRVRLPTVNPNNPDCNPKVRV